MEGSNSPKPEEALRCCAASLEPTGLYLVYAPLTMLLWVGTQVPVRTLVELFNTNCFSSLPSGEVGAHIQRITLQLQPRCAETVLPAFEFFSPRPFFQIKLPVLDNPLSISVRSLVDELNARVPFAHKVSRRCLSCCVLLTAS